MSKCEICKVSFNGQYMSDHGKIVKSDRCKKCAIKYFDQFTPQELKERKKKGLL